MSEPEQEGNEAHDIMNDMEQRLDLMGLGESAYLILVGAQSGGCDSNVDAMIIITSFFMSKTLTTEIDPTEEEDATETD